MALQIGSHLSKFCSANELIMDSLLFENRNKDISSSFSAIQTGLNGRNTHIFCRYKVYKNYPKQGETSFSSYQGGSFLRVTERMNLAWKIYSNKDTLLLGYHCQKAGTYYAGRNYTAWFSTEIPMRDGPYKFCGLPGLILKICDSKNQHQFTLTSIQKMKYIKPITFNKSNYKDVNAPEFVKALQVNIERLFGKIQGGDVVFNSEEHKAKSLQNLKARNNFIERY